MKRAESEFSISLLSLGERGIRVVVRVEGFGGERAVEHSLTREQAITLKHDLQKAIKNWPKPKEE